MTNNGQVILTAGLPNLNDILQSTSPLHRTTFHRTITPRLWAQAIHPNGLTEYDV